MPLTWTDSFLDAIGAKLARNICIDTLREGTKQEKEKFTKTTPKDGKLLIKRLKKGEDKMEDGAEVKDKVEGFKSALEYLMGDVYRIDVRLTMGTDREVDLKFSHAAPLFALTHSVNGVAIESIADRLSKMLREQIVYNLTNMVNQLKGEEGDEENVLDNRSDEALWESARKRYMRIYQIADALVDGMRMDGNEELGIPPCDFCHARVSCMDCDWGIRLGECGIATIKKEGCRDAWMDARTSAIELRRRVEKILFDIVEIQKEMRKNG